MIDFLIALCLDLLDLCHFLREKHQLRKLTLVGIQLKVLVSALNTESITMEDLDSFVIHSVRTFLHFTSLSLKNVIHQTGVIFYN